jgi:hypothetical protein
MSDETIRNAGSRAGAWVGGVLLALVIYALSVGPVISFSVKWGFEKQMQEMAPIVYAPLVALFHNSEAAQQVINDYVHWWDQVAGVPPTEL